ncbi:radical SAM protein [Candidatus Bathyarchaeota archaeon]|nr:radical SAM protein [Candidatus Bathyarchaeota archaeon]
MRKLYRTKGGSFYVGQLPRGCQLCQRGAKLVLFITGMCIKQCFYCPLSEERRGKDVVYADEVKVLADNDVVQEARVIQAEGTGLTGGDPLIFPKRVLHYIRLLKSEFGEKHHIHLYTTGRYLTKSLLRQLRDAGLDEIRFHPDKVDLPKISWAAQAAITVGVEVPAIPSQSKEIIALIKYLGKVRANFININELEFTETNTDALLIRGIRPKPPLALVAEGSEETAFKVLDWALRNTHINVHYCPARIKDAVQFRNRMKRKAKCVAKPNETITKDGLLSFGIIKLTKATQATLERFRDLLINKYRIPQDLVTVNLRKKRIETSIEIIKKLWPKIRFKTYECGIINEYPTQDRTEVLYTRLH